MLNLTLLKRSSWESHASQDKADAFFLLCVRYDFGCHEENRFVSASLRIDHIPAFGAALKMSQRLIPFPPDES